MASSFNPSRVPTSTASPASSMSYLWFLWSFVLVLILDVAGAKGTIPANQQFPLLNLGLAAALAVIWHRGWKMAPGVALAALLSAALRGLGWWGAPIYAGGLIAGVAAAHGLLKLFAFDYRLRNITHVLVLALLAGPVGSFVTALCHSFLAHPAVAGGLVTCFLANWLAGWTGILMMTPFIFSLSSEYFERWNPARVREWLLVNLMLVTSLIVMMSYLTINDQLRYPLAYLALPCIFWTSWRFGTAGAALANLFVGAVTSLCAQSGYGPFSNDNGIMVLILAWGFLGFHGLVALLLAAFTDERRVEIVKQRQRAQFLRRLLDQLPCGVLLKDIADKPLLVNRRWFQFFGQSEGTEEDQLRHQSSIEPFWRERELTLLQNLGEISREETDSVDFENHPVELLLTKQAAYFEERGERLLMVVADDISSGRGSLAEARETLARVRETLSVAEVGFWEWHIPTSTIRFDAEFSKLSGLPETPEGLPVTVWQDGIHPDDRAQFQHDMLQHLHHQAELFATRFRFRRGDKWIWLVVRGRVVEQDVRKLGVRMIGTLQHARATVVPLPDPNATAKK
jgi:integral membrane sensor domain MASE1